MQSTKLGKHTDWKQPLKFVRFPILGINRVNVSFELFKKVPPKCITLIVINPSWPNGFNLTWGWLSSTSNICKTHAEITLQ